MQCGTGVKMKVLCWCECCVVLEVDFWICRVDRVISWYSMQLVVRVCACCVTEDKEMKFY